MIDLHTHTDASDGSLAPEALVRKARSLGLEALSICDHDTLAGYDQAAEPARREGLELVCGIEISGQQSPGGRSIHLLGYFLDGPPSQEFRNWLIRIQEARHDRNQRLAARLGELGLEVRLEEAQAMGRNLTGRAHFARLLLAKGYVSSVPDAFRRYLGENGAAYVERGGPETDEVIRRINQSGGMPILAHPIRSLKKADREDALGHLCDAGLRGIEAYHSDHSPADTQLFLGLARHLGLAASAGSDYHGEAKPGVELGTGIRGNLAVPYRVLQELRASQRR